MQLLFVCFLLASVSLLTACFADVIWRSFELGSGLSEYFPVSSFKLHRGVSMINNSQNVKLTKLQIESQNVREIPPNKPRVTCVRDGHSYLTIIPRTRVGYELLDSGRGAKHRVGYHKLISNKRE